jgi:hypothetical protein
MVDADPGLQQGAYITDGTDLYEVLGIRRGPAALGVSTVRILAENCRNLRGREFLPDKIPPGLPARQGRPSGRVSRPGRGDRMVKPPHVGGVDR